MMLRIFSTLAAICLVTATMSTATANKLVNGNFEATPADVYFDGFNSSLADDVPGWNLFLGAADGSYVLVNGVGSGNVDLDMANGPASGGLETAAGSRPSVVPGLGYIASVTTDNYFAAPAAVSYFIDWFDGGGSLISSAGGPLPMDPNGPFFFSPYTQLFTVAGTAPPSSATAGVRFISVGGYEGLTADNFSLVPEPTSFVLFGMASLVLVGLRSRNRS